MSSLRRVLSSRANGARSLGPVSPAGKERSSLNAIRHGLLAKCVVLRNESRDGFDSLLKDFIAHFNPVDSVELGFVEEMLSAFWRQRRNWAIETSMIDTAVDREPSSGDEMARLSNASTAASVESHLALMRRYESQLHRMFQRALYNLALVRCLKEETPPAGDPPAHAIDITKQTQSHFRTPAVDVDGHEPRL